VACCPFDGEPLGRGDEWLIVDAGGKVHGSATGQLGDLAIDEQMLQQGQLQAGLDEAAQTLGLLSSAIEALDEEELDVALEITGQVLMEKPEHPLALLIRQHCFERSNEHVRSWQMLRALLRVHPVTAAKSALESELVLRHLRASDKAVGGLHRLQQYQEELRALLGSTLVEVPVQSPELVEELRSITRSWPQHQECDHAAQTGSCTPLPDIDRLIDHRYGKIVAQSPPRQANHRLLVLGHEYLFPEQQRIIYRQLEHILAQSPRTPILMEGSAGPRKRRFWATIGNPKRRLKRAFSLLEQQGQLAADVLARLHPTRGVIHGIDQPELRTAQQQQQQALDAAISSALPAQAAAQMSRVGFVRSSFEGFGLLLQDLVQRSLKGPLSELLQMGATGEGGLAAEASRLAELATQAGFAINAPTVKALSKATRMEEEIDLAKADAERNRLIEKLGQINDAELSAKRRRAVERWLSEDPLVAEGAIEQTGTWFERLMLLTLASRQGLISAATFYSRLLDLLTCLGVDLSAATNLRAYAMYSKIVDGIDRNAMVSELPWFRRQLIDHCVSSGVEYGIISLSRQLDRLRRLLMLELPASQVRRFAAEPRGVVDCVIDLLHLCEHLLDRAQLEDQMHRQWQQLAVLCAPILEQALPHALGYYLQACRRSEEMAKQVLAWQLDSSPVVVVCGRFHLDALLGSLDQAGVSWALVAPSCEGETSSQTAACGWLSPDQEVVPV
jgi:hypothetical protein